MFTYGPFSENTYVLEDSDSKECIIIDPGMYGSTEQNDFLTRLKELNLIPKLLLNTHCHIDHVLGNKFVKDIFNLDPHGHELAAKTLTMAEMSAQIYGLSYDHSPELITDLKHGEFVKLQGHKLKILFIPGHAPGHVGFYNEKEGYLIGGDVLFRESVGRVDLPGSNAADLAKSIKEQIYVLPEETLIYPGHGPETTVGHEKKNNPLVKVNEKVEPFLG